MSSTDIDVTTTTKLKPPVLYKVVFLNDDKTPFDFVILVLMQIFRKTNEEAVALAQQIHEQGSGLAGIYHFEIAEAKKEQTLTLAREHEFPLKVRLEEVY